MKAKIIIVVAIQLFFFTAKLMGQPPYSSSHNINTVGIGGSDCSGWGWDALINANSNYGFRNTAMGYKAMELFRAGNDNTAFGARSLLNTGPTQVTAMGHYNTGLGAFALYSNTTGELNSATGYKALYSNTTGKFNTAAGTEALYSNTVGRLNTATGYRALFSNAGSGGDYGRENTATGHSALYSNIDGDKNTATGKDALYSNTTGDENTAIGNAALKNNSNVSGTYGLENTAVGDSTMFNNLSGQYNTATGSHALFSNVSGDYNTAHGANALHENASGDGNVALGVNALYENLGGNNTAIGVNALLNNTSGSQNTAAGASCLTGNTTGDYNTAIGYGAGVNNVANVADDDANTYLGDYTRITNNSSTGNITLIGHFATMASTSADAVRFGDVWVTTLETQSKWIVSSDGRFKFNVLENDVKGLEFIKRLRPVVYNFNTKKMAENLGKDLPDSLKRGYLRPDYLANMAIRHSGFIAQEVENAAKEVGYNFDAIKIPEGENGYYGLSYSLFVVPLVKAVQEQQKLLALQEKRNELLSLKSRELDRIMIEKQRTSTEAEKSKYLLGELEINKEGEVPLVYGGLKKGRKYVLGLYNLNGSEIVRYDLADESGVFKIPAAIVENGSFVAAVISKDEVLAIKKLVVQ